MSSRYGEVTFATVEFTSSGAGSVRKNYPIKQKFKCISTANRPKEPPNDIYWQLYPATANIKYWYPFSNTDFSIDSVGYVVYTPGAEFNYIEPKPKSSAELVLPVFSNGPQGRWNPQSVGIKSLVYANEIYNLSTSTISWKTTGLPDDRNPYNTSNISVWYRLGDNATSFWYHPNQKRFYPVSKSLAELQYRELSTIGDTSSDIYSKFTGAAQELNLSNFTMRQIEELELRGMSRREAEELIRSKQAEATRLTSLASRYGGTGSSTGQTTPSSNNSDSSSQSENQQEDTGTPNRSVVATIKKSINSRILALGESKKAEMVQYYRNLNGDYSLTPDRFVFRYYPNNVSYTDIGANWTEIDRVNNTPFVDFRNFKLMKISFEFVVGDNTNLMTSCDDELKLLRQMATRPESVIFLGMDKMFTEQLIYPSWTGGSGVEFAIVDLQITSVQRVQQPPDGNSQSSPRGEIARATCNMTIQELPLEGPNLIVMPKIARVNTPSIPGDTPTSTCVELLWSNASVTKNKDKRACGNEQTKP